MGYWKKHYVTRSKETHSWYSGHCKIQHVFDAIGIKALCFSGNILPSCK